MKRKLSKIFICPKCGNFLKLKIIKKFNKRIKQGFLLCQKCNTKYEVINDIVCFKRIKAKDKDEKKIKSH